MRDYFQPASKHVQKDSKLAPLCRWASEYHTSWLDIGGSKTSKAVKLVYLPSQLWSHMVHQLRAQQNKYTNLYSITKVSFSQPFTYWIFCCFYRKQQAGGVVYIYFVHHWSSSAMVAMCFWHKWHCSNNYISIIMEAIHNYNE